MSLKASILLLFVALATVTVAGCASSTPIPEIPSAEPPVSVPPVQRSHAYVGDPVLGEWTWLGSGDSSTDLQVSYIFVDDGTFTRHDTHVDRVKIFTGTWTKASETKYSLYYPRENPGFNGENMYLSHQTGYLSNEVYDAFKKVG